MTVQTGRILSKTAGVIVVAALFLNPAAPASASKKKVSGHFGASLLPFPNDAHDQVTTTPGCSGGLEDIHWVGEEFTAPAPGKLTASMSGFVGDHDLYVLDGTEVLASSEQIQVPPDAPAEEELTYRLKAGQKILMVGCNWLGQPDVLVKYEFTFNKK